MFREEKKKKSTIYKVCKEIHYRIPYRWQYHKHNPKGLQRLQYLQNKNGMGFCSIVATFSFLFSIVPIPKM